MPTPHEILGGLSAIANDWRFLAVVWHGYFALLLLLLAFGLRPRRTISGVLLTLPLFSVSALAWIYANPFNSAIFMLLGILLICVVAGLPRGSVGVSSKGFAVPGALLNAFGWIYPHFLYGVDAFSYLYFAPLGLVPCPTLSVAIGFTLLLRGLGSRAWCLLLSAAGAFYGVFGAVRLGVMIDWVLVMGALVTVYAAFSSGFMSGYGGSETHGADHDVSK